MAEFVVNQYKGVYKRAEELYDEGKYKEAVQLFKMVVENDPENYAAGYYLADCLYNGKGAPKDLKTAFQLFMTAATNKVTEACYMVGMCYLSGTGINQDSTQAVAWFTEAAKYAHPLSQYYLGLAYMNGDGITKDIPRAAQWLVHAAKQGIVEAQRDAAICYEALGKFKGAATLYLASAEAGDAYAQERIADCYADGIGTLQCTELAVHYYELAAGQGNVKAQLKIGNRYSTGNGVPQSMKNAIYWWMKAANANDPDAQNALAECYAAGNGVYKNHQQAITWWTKAAAQGNIQSMVHLAETNALPPQDEDMTQDLVTAKYWWTKAAEAGDPYAMCRLGECLEKGYGIAAPNYEDAFKWYRLASQNGNEEATENCKRFTKKGMKGRVKVKKAK